VSTTYYLVSWTDQERKSRGRPPTTREYGTASSKQAATRLAERLLPPVTEYMITDPHRPSRPHPTTTDHARQLPLGPP
jgi:hypothetical protein